MYICMYVYMYVCMYVLMYDYIYVLFVTEVIKWAARTNNNLNRKEMFYLTAHSTHFICGYMASDTW